MDTQSTQPIHKDRLGERTQAQLGMLVVMFLLGIAVNLIGSPSETTGSAKTASTVFLALHGLLGVGLLVNAGLIIRFALKTNTTVVRQAQIGAGVILLTFIAGVITNETKNNWWSFAMAAGFAASLPIYGLLLLRVRTKQLHK